MKKMLQQIFNTVKVAIDTFTSGLALSIRKKMLAAFAVMIGLLLFTSAINFFISGKVRETTGLLVDTYTVVAESAALAKSNLVAAQLAEANYRIRFKEFGFEYAEEYIDNLSTQVDEFKAHTATAKARYQHVLETETDPDSLAAANNSLSWIDVMDSGIDSYRSKVREIVNKLKEVGYKDTGLLGSLRDATHKIETIADEKGLDAITLPLLMMRRHEKDYLLRGETQYISQFQDTATELRNNIEDAPISRPEKNALNSALNTYTKLFDQVITANDEIARLSLEALEYADDISPYTANLAEQAGKEEKLHKEELLTLDRVAVIVTVVATFFGITAGIMLAIIMSGALTKQINKIMELFGEVGMGNYDARVEVATKDELGTMSMSLNAMLDNTLSLIQTSEEREQMQSAIMRLLVEISALQEGNLNARAVVTEDATGAIADAFNEMADRLGSVVKGVQIAAEQVGSTAKDVTVSTEHLAQTSEAQAMQISDAIAAINEMAASIQQVAENASQSAKVSELSATNALDGAMAVKNTSEAMENIRENVQETARAIKRLGESSQEIGNIVQIINEIADRTSILALNASIQAAMAGDAGRGFAVVAEEVQRLAERSTNSTKQIETLVTNIQAEINEAGTSMEESIQRVVEGTSLAQGARGKLEEIQRVSTELKELIESISMAAQQQARASENISKTMEEVGEVSSNTSAASRQTAVSMQKLNLTAEELRQAISIFTLEQAAKARAAA